MSFSGDIQQIKCNQNKKMVLLEHRRSQRGAEGPPPNWNASNDKNVKKNLSFLQFQFFLAFFAYNIPAYNNDEQ